MAASTPRSAFIKRGFPPELFLGLEDFLNTNLIDQVLATKIGKMRFLVFIRQI